MPSKSPCVDTRLARLAFTSNFKGLTPLVIYLSSPAPGEKTLKNATPVQLQDLQVSDRILVAGKASDDAKSITARRTAVLLALNNVHDVHDVHDVHHLP
jgi:hypothetical protein